MSTLEANSAQNVQVFGSENPKVAIEAPVGRSYVAWLSRTLPALR